MLAAQGTAAVAASGDRAPLPDEPLVSPEMTARLARLALLARKLPEARRRGLRRTRRVGSGIEAIDTRPYSPGDDPRYLDWRLYARSDRYYIKRFEDETNLRAWLLVDAMNRCWQQPLVETSPGSAHGGGARVSAFGESILAHYRALQARIDAAAECPDFAALQAAILPEPRKSQKG